MRCASHPRAKILLWVVDSADARPSYEWKHRKSMPDDKEPAMAEYLILIYESEADWEAAASPEVYQRVMDAHNRFPEQVEALGAKIVSGRALQPTTTATSVRGGDAVTDGPFAETKEALGGFYLIEAKDLDQALAVGKLCPAEFGGVEVRPIMVFE
jgi:hypothetical protein